VGVIFFGLLPLPGLLAATAFLFGLMIVLVVHSRRARPWRPVLVRAGVSLALVWLAISAGTLMLMHRFTYGGPVEGSPGAVAHGQRLFALVILVAVLLLAVAGGLLAWIASASRRAETTSRPA
jgi:hypothetical protein